MKIVFTSTGKDMEAKVDPRFGRAEFFLVYDDEKDSFEAIDNSEAASMAHGAGPKSAEKLFKIKPDILITGNGPGGNAAAALQKMNMKIYIGAGNMKIKDALDSYKNNKLSKL